MNDSSPEFPDLRSAFCSRFRCTPDAFVRKAFWKGLPLRVKILTVIFGGMSHPRFQHDLEMIRTAGDATSMDDINRVFDEMWSLHEMNRDRLRHWLGLRPSTERLQTVFSPLIQRVRAVRSEWEEQPVTKSLLTPVRGDEGRSRSGDVAVHRMRRAIRIHAAVAHGRDLELILMEERLSRRELDELVGEFARLRPELKWLQGYLREMDELEELRRHARRTAALTVA